uniref:Lon proteolytic domain-containing protein n=1 Tax=Meloidogyne enterolobii TaxID=390850 RepID=A0A6V7TMW3_MELEN|nr:unnamed protein product [Meloidogyne enterolobii]
MLTVSWSSLSMFENNMFIPDVPNAIKRSVARALLYIEELCCKRGIPFTKQQRNNFVFEFEPEDANRDGESAGIPISIALLSRILNKAPASDIAATGIISSTGKLTRIGGLPQKIEAAVGMGKRRILLPREMMEEFEGLKEEEKRGMTAEYADYFEEFILTIFGI